MIYKEDLTDVLERAEKMDTEVKGMIWGILHQLCAYDKEHAYHFPEDKCPQLYATLADGNAIVSITEIWLNIDGGSGVFCANYKEVNGEREFTDVPLEWEAHLKATEILACLDSALEYKPTKEFYVVHECVCNHSYVACMSENWDAVRKLLRENYGMDSNEIAIFHENREYYMVTRDTKLFLEKVPVDTFVGVSNKTVDKIGRDKRVAEHLSQC